MAVVRADSGGTCGAAAGGGLGGSASLTFGAGASIAVERCYMHVEAKCQNTPCECRDPKPCDCNKK